MSPFIGGASAVRQLDFDLIASPTHVRLERRPAHSTHLYTSDFLTLFIARGWHRQLPERILARVVRTELHQESCCFFRVLQDLVSSFDTSGLERLMWKSASHDNERRYASCEERRTGSCNVRCQYGQTQTPGPLAQTIQMGPAHALRRALRRRHRPVSEHHRPSSRALGHSPARANRRRCRPCLAQCPTQFPRRRNKHPVVGFCCC